MASSYSPIPGRVCSVSITSPGLILPFNRFAWDGQADMIDVTAFTSNGFREFIAGLKSQSFIFGGVMGTQWNPFVNAPVLKLGTKITGVVITLQGTLASTSPNALVARWNVTGTPPGSVEYICALQSDFTFNDFSNTAA